MENCLQSLLQNSLQGARRIAVLGIGSELRGDDAAGTLVAQNIAKKNIGNKKITVKAFLGATAPENLTGEIKRFKPSHLVIIDTVDTGQKPGTVLVLDPEVVGGATFSTHTMPAKILAGYLKKSTHCKITIIGIQARSIHFGDAVSKDVMGSVHLLSDSLIKTINRLGNDRAKAE